MPYLHARTFLTCLAQIGRALRALSSLDLGASQAAVVAARDEFDAALPALAHVRNSIEHAEDRARGLGKGGRKLTLAGISNNMIEAPGGGC